MRDAVRRSQTTELTLQGMSHTNVAAPWTSYYNMLLSTAKLIDKDKSTSAKTQLVNHNASNTTATANSAPKRGSNTNSTTPTPPRTYARYTGKNMVMKASYNFSSADWKKLTPDQ